MDKPRVKPLEWEDWSARHRTNLTAITQFGRYGIMQLHFPEMHYKIEPPHGKPFSASTLEAAEAAAQADYEARILAALEPVTVRICQKCGHPENNHPYRHMFVALAQEDTR